MGVNHRIIVVHQTLIERHKMTLPKSLTVQIGDTVLLIGKDRKPFVRTVRQGRVIQTHLGEIVFDQLIGLRYGEKFYTGNGQFMYILQPTLEDVLTQFQRRTQIIYPKDLGYILLKLGLQQGMSVIEAGTGSGAMAAALALMVGDEGHVYSYERHASRLQAALDNLKMIGLDERVTFTLRDISEGFEQKEVHAVFLDVPNPYDYLDVARAALRGGGILGAIVPTANQVIDLLTALYQGPWFMIQAEELILRSWKTAPARVRPDEQMFGHTGILVFARAIHKEVVPEISS